MSAPTRTFALQAVAVAVVVGIVFFAFLRPSDVGELSGIEAPQGEPPFATPGEKHRGEKRSKRSNKTRKGSVGATTLVRNGFGPAGGKGAPFVGDNPADDQYVGTVASLAARVKGPSTEPAR